MRIGVVVFPGSNCDRDAAHAMEQLGHEVVMLWHKDAAIADFTPEDCIILLADLVLETTPFGSYCKIFSNS